MLFFEDEPTKLVTLRFGNMLETIFLAILAGGFIGYPVALCLFLPQHLLLSGYRLWGYRYYFLIGVTSGLAATLLIFLGGSGPHTLAEFFKAFPLLTVPSIMAALSFRLLAGHSFWFDTDKS